jgi:Transposase domain (DUF772)
VNDSRADPDSLSAPEIDRKIADHRRGAAWLSVGAHSPTQFSVHRERVAEVRRWLSNYQELKGAIEAVCELNMICCARNGLHQNHGGSRMIGMRRTQLSFGDGLIAEEVSYLRESGMIHADAVLVDEDIVAAVYEALAKRHPKSRCRGRRGAPAEMVLRLLVIKHIRNWSYEALEREVRANLVHRDFTRVGGGKMPNAKTMGRWGRGARAGGAQAGS